MKIHWNNLTDEIIERADFIEAVDPETRRAFRIWHREAPAAGYPGTRLESLVVYMRSSEFGELKSRVRTVKGCLPALVECLNI